jgi:hypothetical protein
MNEPDFQRVIYPYGVFLTIMYAYGVLIDLRYSSCPEKGHEQGRGEVIIILKVLDNQRLSVRDRFTADCLIFSLDNQRLSVRDRFKADCLILVIIISS